MVTIPFALSIHKFVNSVGADVGFASIIAVAILILLYFAHARETATLRERLDEAQTRIGALEARIAQLMHAQAAAQRGRVPGPVAPPPVTPSPVRPMGSAIASVRRVPNPATAAAAAGAPVATAVGVAAVASPTDQSSGSPAAPVGMAAPALASATKLIPDPVAPPAHVGAPDDTVFVPAATAAAATNGKTTETRPLTSATQAIPAVAAASARTASASPRGGATPPPRVQIGAEPATAGAGARRTAPPSRTAPLLPPAEEGRRRRLAGRMLPLLIGGIAVVVIIVGLIVITNTGGSTTGNVSHGNTAANQTGANLAHTHHTPAPFKPSKFKVAVLNGTAVSNLAADVGTKLAGSGYKKGNATNAASQTQALTVVYYMPGSAAKANRIAAQHVAKALNLAATRVHPATQASIQSCSISATGSPLNSCSADVIVSVGSDRASLASGGSSG